VAGSWRRPLNEEELRNLYAAPNIIRGIKTKAGEMDGACSMHGRDEICV
jgi:hypothetical protein